MAMFNRVILLGNVGADPEIRSLDNQGTTKVASFSLATTEKYTDRKGERHENTEWHRITAWKERAELVEKYVHKGDRVFVEGKLTTRKWTDKDGKDHSVTEINVTNIQLLGKPASAPSEEQKASAPQEKPSKAFQELLQDDDNPQEDLPF